ncbi:MAG: hypothetical protein ABSE73_08010 [Planctomycetota bacterium]
MRRWCAIFAIVLCPAVAGEQPAPGRAVQVDPAARLAGAGPLTVTEREALLNLFYRVNLADFEGREQARAKLVEYGPRALSVARELETSEEIEIREFARRFATEMALEYRGYLPVSPSLLELLEGTQRVFIGKRESFAEAFRRFARDAGLRAIFKDRSVPEVVLGSGKTVEFQASVGEALQQLVGPAGLAVVARGAALVLLPPQQAAELRRQQCTLQMDSLGLSRPAADRLARAVESWLPPDSEASATEAGLRVRSNEAGVRICARAIALLEPESAAAQFPKSPATGGLFDRLARPVGEFVLASEEVSAAVTRLRLAGHPVEMARAQGGGEQPRATLDLRGVPLGLCLNWLAARCGTSLQFTCEAEPPAIAISRPSSVIEPLPPDCVGGTGAGFLFRPEDAAGPSEADEAVARRIRAALSDHWALYPCPAREYALLVWNRRALVRGPAALVAQTLSLLEQWRKTGTAPAAQWRAAIEARLKAEVRWSGDAGAATLLGQLREATGLNLLLERDEQGQALRFELAAAEAHLLPEGSYPAEKLLDKLCALLQARWAVRNGVIVLSKAGGEEVKR